eukprot:TRINITY_DN28796_c0_g1_i1.p1 TRINITY_DN28796_c0_g1~~TRINITY_DN28796_c0_g1_i1.p1  ORF type:complete len:823 (-),score=232.89 TRINITY_DN28796_c0_g1_i1:90-2513(-)
MADSKAPRERRRVGALLNAYYHIEKKDDTAAVVAPKSSGSDLDQQGFDAKRYFDNMVGSGQLPDLVKRANELDAEVKDLDGDMQMLVYENYSKFIRATDVIKQMKFTIEGLEPDLKQLEGNVGRITEHQKKVEDGVSSRAGQIEGLLKQQRVCKKLQVLFELPSTLQRCLDRKAYGEACEAYCCCSAFLRQYRNMPTFQKVLEEVELQMGRIRVALEERLRSPELSVDEAVNSSVTLLDLGEDQVKVAREYLTGRTAQLRRSLEHCFDVSTDVAPAAAVSNSEGGEEESANTGVREASKDEEELRRPESAKLHAACSRATELYVPPLCDAVEGFQKLIEGRSGPGAASVDPNMLTDFVSARIEELCERISQLVDKKCPPTRVLVSCIHSVRDSLRRLHSLLPQLLTKLFRTFLTRTAMDAMKALFTSACKMLVVDLCKLHADCKSLQESPNSGLDDVLEEIAKTEESLMVHVFNALTECEPLKNLVGTDKVGCQQLVRGLHTQLIVFFLTCVEICHTYVGNEPSEARKLDASLPLVPRPASEEMSQVAQLDWSGLFALALVRVGRHLEVKAINKVWGVAKELFDSLESASSELMPNPAVLKATRTGAQVVLTHYAVMNGQRLAHWFRNAIQSRNWMTVREPQEPRKIVEMVMREVHAFDAQLTRILGDSRKPKATSDHRRNLSRFKNSMELEMERLWAKKLQVYAPIPFNRNGAIVGILRIAFKAFFEYMREETFGKFGLQQIQMDCAFIAEMVRDYVEADDASVLDSLLDEVVTSAQMRCVDPVLMEASIVEARCDEKKKKFKLEQ